MKDALIKYQKIRNSGLVSVVILMVTKVSLVR